MWNAAVYLERSDVRRRQCLFVEKAQAILIGKRSFLQWLVKNSVTTAQHGLVVDTVGKSYAWTESFRVDILRALAAIASRPTSEVRVGPQDVAGAGVWERRVYCGEAVECFTSRLIEVVAESVVQREARSKSVRILGIKVIVLVTNSAEATVVQGSLIHEPEERTGHGIAVSVSAIACLSRIEVEFAGSLRKPPNVKLQEPESASQFEIVLALDPAYGVVQLINIVGKF